jgi:hypothetical protein
VSYSVLQHCSVVAGPICYVRELCLTAALLCCHSAVAAKGPAICPGARGRRHALPKKTFEADAQAHARLIVQLKDNQPTLLHNVQARPPAATPPSPPGTAGHETRTADVFSATRAVPGTEWQSLRSFAYKHTALQSVLNIQPGSIRRRSRRSRCGPQVEIQLRALNSPGDIIRVGISILWLDG